MKNLVKQQIATMNPKRMISDITLSNDESVLDILEDILVNNTKSKQPMDFLVRQSIGECTTESIVD